MSAAENNETTDSVAEILAALVNGHRNLSSLLLYYNASADELADRL